MSKVDVAQQATGRRPLPVESRKVLWSGGVVQVSVPDNAMDGIFTDNGQSTRYLQFPRLVKGGLVNCFVHNDLSCRGRKITARVEILQKSFVDGRKFLHVDLHPVVGEAPTHRLAIMPAGTEIEAGRGWEVFKTPSPLEGVIILSPPEAKIGVPTTKYVSRADENFKPVVSKPVPPPAPLRIAKTGDSQLDRLLAQGWAIDCKGFGTITLWKMKNGERVTIIHHCPKKSARK